MKHKGFWRNGMKRVLAFMLLFVFAFAFIMPVFAETEQNNEAEAYKLNSIDLDPDCESALLMEAETGTVLYAYNESHSASPASVTKVMTLLLVMEAIEDGALALDDEISISENASSMGGSQVFLKEGERMSAEDLIKCTVISSANDAAVALAERVAGSVEAFVGRMNERAAELGMKNTHFDNPTGLDDTTDDNYTSAMDIAIMSRELIRHELITGYSSLWQDSIRNGEFTLTNTNRLVRYYDGCNGLKTGSTDKAGFCISAAAKRDGMQLIAVVKGAKTRDGRNEIARRLLDLGFANYAVYSEPETEVERVPVYGGTVDSATVYSRPFSSIVNKSDVPKISKVYNIPDHITAPFKCTDALGDVGYEIGGKTIGKSELFIIESIDKIRVPGLFLRIVSSAVLCDAKNGE